jgi:hypothetical protein
MRKEINIRIQIRMSNKVIFDESIDNFLNGFIDKTAATSNSN